MEDEATGQRCRKCRRSFRVMADEAGSHACPHCGYAPWDDRDEDEAEETT